MSTAIKTTQIDGDVSVGRSVSMGGSAKVSNDVVVKHNVYVEGWLDAPNIKGNNKGYFESLTKLKAAYPSPKAGWCAAVGPNDDGKFVLYDEKDGEWHNTEKTVVIDQLTAYDVWKANGHPTGTVEEYLADIKGETGATGSTGAKGSSAYEVWKDAGHTGSEQDFLDSLKGETGATGAAGAKGSSAYEVWKENGHPTGTEQEFLNSLKGKDGGVLYPTFDLEPESDGLHLKCIIPTTEADISVTVNTRGHLILTI